MKLALLGCDDETLALVRGAIAGGKHALVAACDAGNLAGQVQEIAPRARLNEDWEALLLGSIADVVIVARGRLDPSRATGFAADERRNDQLRKLVQAAVPLVVIHPGCEAIVGYELDMIRSDSGGIIVPFIPGQNPAAVASLEDIAGSQEASPIGPPEQFIFEREMKDRSRDKVLAQLARDVSLARRFIGEIRKLSATGPAAGETRDPLAARPKTLPSLENLAVHLSGEQPFPARWTLIPAEQEEQLRITAIGQRGRAAATISSGLAPQASLKVTTTGEKQPGLIHFPSDDGFLELLGELERAIASRHENAEWLSACRDVEVAASVDRSLDRGRAVEFHGEQHTEEQSFKGVMAVGGCLMLSVALVGLLVAATVEGLQLPLRESKFWRAWPIYLLFPIVLFLLLQLLQFVARRPPKAREA